MTTPSKQITTWKVTSISHLKAFRNLVYSRLLCFHFTCQISQNDVLSKDQHYVSNISNGTSCRSDAKTRETSAKTHMLGENKVHVIVGQQESPPDRILIIAHTDWISALQVSSRCHLSRVMDCLLRADVWELASSPVRRPSCSNHFDINLQQPTQDHIL